jgi:hypothetical protein
MKLFGIILVEVTKICVLCCAPPFVLHCSQKRECLIGALCEDRLFTKRKGLIGALCEDRLFTKRENLFEALCEVAD